MRGTAPTLTAGPPSISRLRRGGRRGVALAVAGVLGVGGLTTLATGIADAAVPTFPDNVVVFPERDFVTIEGYQDHIGETATVEVTRGGTVVGSAKGKVAEGDVAFEINHPGGYCWGEGTGLAVTPDIKAGDKVTIKFADGTTGDTTVPIASVTSHAKLGTGGTVTVQGQIDPALNGDHLEQRIVNPDLTALVGKRDVRAVPGGTTTGGYTSDLTVAADGAFTATYKFTDPKAAEIAAGTGIERLMYWQVEDADANRQGLTISEFGESGGPGFGGCPAGPATSAPTPGTYAATRSASDPSKIAVTWTPATAQPGADPVTGYDVEVIAADGTTDGKRAAATASSATVTVPAALGTYDVEVRPVTGKALGLPFDAQPAGTPTDQQPSGDLTNPPVSASPAPGDTAAAATTASSVTLSSEAAAQIFYTDDGSSVLTGDLPSDSAKLYTKPIAIAGPMELHYVAFDAAGNFTQPTGQGFYKPASEQVLNAPSNLVATGGIAQASLKWTAPTGSSTPVTGYQVTASTINADGTTTALTAQPAVTPDTNQVVTGLAAGTKYSFTVRALYGAAASAESAPATATTSVASAKVAITTGRWKNADTRIQGTTDTAPGAGTIRFYKANADGTANTTAPLFGTVGQALTAAVAPATGSTFDARYRTTALTGSTNPSTPGKIVAVLSDSSNKVLGTSAPFTLA